MQVSEAIIQKQDIICWQIQNNGRSDQ